MLAPVEIWRETHCFYKKRELAALRRGRKQGKSCVTQEELGLLVKSAVRAAFQGGAHAGGISGSPTLHQALNKAKLTPVPSPMPALTAELGKPCKHCKPLLQEWWWPSEALCSLCGTGLGTQPMWEIRDEGCCCASIARLSKQTVGCSADLESQRENRGLLVRAPNNA